MRKYNSTSYTHTHTHTHTTLQISEEAAEEDREEAEEDLACQALFQAPEEWVLHKVLTSRRSVCHQLPSLHIC